MSQKILNSMSSAVDIINQLDAKKMLVVSGKNISKSEFVVSFLNKLDINYKIFCDFTPNPKIEDAEKGVAMFKDENFDFILTIGGGSSLDVSKFIKYYTNVPLVAVPTTAGSGSEATKFAVIYKNGEKMSLSHENLIPEYVILEPYFLKSLPTYQKKCTMLDALCHSIESYWSVNSTAESKNLSRKAILIIMKNYQNYLADDESAYGKMLLASNLAGQAINITQTTAGHAMSYKLTSQLGLPHGHAVAICLSAVWQFLQNNLELCSDKRGKQFLADTVCSLSEIINLKDFKKLLEQLEIYSPEYLDNQQIEQLADSVNATRLKNFPLTLSKENIENIYRTALNSNQNRLQE